MTDRLVHWGVALTPKEVEASRELLEAHARYPGEVATLARELEALVGENPDRREAVETIVARLLTGARIAHERSEWLWERMRKGQFHESKGTVH